MVAPESFCYVVSRKLVFARAKSSCLLSSNANSKTSIFEYDVIMTSRTPYDTHHGAVINRDKFDACTSSSFKGVKTERHACMHTHTHIHTQTDRIALHSIEYRCFHFQPIFDEIISIPDLQSVFEEFINYVLISRNVFTVNALLYSDKASSKSILS